MDYLVLNQAKIDNSDEIANRFNSYFATTGHTLAASIASYQNCSFKEYLKTNINSAFNFEFVTEVHIRKIIQILKPKPSFGYDGVSNNLVKYLEPLLSKPLALIVNQSLRSGIFPDKLKLARIIPLHKKGNTHLLENYWPISILPALSKIFEKVVFEQLYLYFVQNNFLSKSQYGFQKTIQQNKLF